MDFIEGLPRSHGREVIFVVVDRLSKYAHFLALSHPFMAKDVAQLFLDNIYKLHELPQTIVRDGSCFHQRILEAIFFSARNSITDEHILSSPI